MSDVTKEPSGTPPEKERMSLEQESHVFVQIGEYAVSAY